MLKNFWSSVHPYEICFLLRDVLYCIMQKNKCHAIVIRLEFTRCSEEKGHSLVQFIRSIGMHD